MDLVNYRRVQADVYNILELWMIRRPITMLETINFKHATKPMK